EQEDAIGEINVNHQTGAEPEENPLCGAAVWPRTFPIPKKQGDSKSRMRMRPRGIEVHINGKRTAKPHAQSGQKSPFFSHVLPGEREGHQETQKSVGGSADGHSQEVRKGKSVCRYMRTKKIATEHEEVRNKEKRKP